MTEFHEMPESEKQRFREHVMSREDWTDAQKERILQVMLNPSLKSQNIEATIKQVEKHLFAEVLPKLPDIRDFNGLEDYDVSLVLYRAYVGLAANALGAWVKSRPGPKPNDIGEFILDAKSGFERAACDLLGERGILA
jgi:hypothetical protein